MSEEKPYSVRDNHEQSELRFDVVCGKRRIVKALYTRTEAQNFADVLNKEIVPMIEALDEKNFEIMQLRERRKD